jgi:KaiC/GvpD/RAD55 family RecA-like ATPase
MPALDAILEGKGFFRGSSVLVSETAGSGKSSIAARFADAACARGESCVYFAFEESPSQIMRNMAVRVSRHASVIARAGKVAGKLWLCSPLRALCVCSNHATERWLMSRKAPL